MKTENRFKVGDYVWVWAWQWDGIPKRTIGRITEIEIDDAGIQCYRLNDLGRNGSAYRIEDQITPATDSEVAWFLVTNEN